jgi:glutamate carboxypeptidase
VNAGDDLAAAARTYLTTLRDREAAMVALTRTLVDLDTPSGRKGLLDGAMERVAEAARERGAEIERVTNERAGDHLVLRWTGHAAARRRALVLAHLDTVWPEGESARRPFAESEGRLTGPGVFDMKAGLVQALFAIEAFAAGSAAADCDVTLAVTSDEETGSVTSRGLIEGLARDADLVLVVEPASGTALKTARKGVGMYEVRVEGVASHAGLDPQNGRSAVLELAHQIIRLHALNDPETGATVTVGRIEGGTSRNVVPALATATVDLRAVTAADAARLDAQIRSLERVTDGTTVSVHGGINRPPMERTSKTAGWYERAAAIAAALGEELGETLVGGGSDGNFTAAMGVATLDGLGAVGGGAHALSEHVLRESMPVRAALLASLLHDLATRGVEAA